VLVSIFLLRHARRVAAPSPGSLPDPTPDTTRPNLRSDPS
jgi:hypothetical protein